jgi:hypothetical protein
MNWVGNVSWAAVAALSLAGAALAQGPAEIANGQYVPNGT